MGSGILTKGKEIPLKEKDKPMKRDSLGRMNPGFPKEFFSCANCGKSFKSYRSSSEKRYCSQKCFFKKLHTPETFKKIALSNKGRIPWNKGINKDKYSWEELIKRTEKYKEWRKLVFERDNYTCQFCGQVGGQLQSDHIKPKSSHKHLVFNLNNGRTLCRKCHKTTDTYGKRPFKIIECSLCGEKIKSCATRVFSLCPKCYNKCRKNNAKDNYRL